MSETKPTTTAGGASPSTDVLCLAAERYLESLTAAQRKTKYANLIYEMAQELASAGRDSSRLNKLASHPSYELLTADPWGRPVFACHRLDDLRNEIDNFDPLKPEWK